MAIWYMASDSLRVAIILYTSTFSGNKVAHILGSELTIHANLF